MARDFLTKTEKQNVVQAIKEAELNTSGEIRVHLESHCKTDTLDRATQVFEQLKMHKTELRNGVLFYLATIDHKFAVIGDAGINAKVSDKFWKKIRNVALEHFEKHEFASGLVEGIKLCGQQLKNYFPYQEDDINELPDDISFGD